MPRTPCTPVFPPIDGTTIQEAMDFNLHSNAEQPFFSYASQESLEVVTITQLEFTRAAHRFAHIVRPNRGGHDGEVVAMIALTDTMLYQTIFIGLVVAGLVPFPISPRNTPAAIVNLLHKASCHRILTTKVTLKGLLNDVQIHLANNNLNLELIVEEIPCFPDIYPFLGREKIDSPFDYYPAPATRPSLDNICAYTHSSGSTGMPKAIPQTHRAFMHWAMFPGVSDFRDNVPPLIVASMALPPFHPMGIFMHVLNPIYGVVPAVIFPPIVSSQGLLPIIPTPNNVLEHAHINKCNAMVIIPAFLQIWSQSKDAMGYLKTLELLIYGGGAMVPKLGNLLVDFGVPLRTMYGGTEFGTVTHAKALPGDEKEWQYMRFHENARVRWVPHGDGIFECQFLSWEKHHLSVENLSDTNGYATSDLWENHPTKKHLWKLVGRADDVIIHSSGEKTVPAPIEDVVMSSPLVQGTIMFGREHDQAGILIEPTAAYAIDVTDDIQLADLRNKLWPIIEEANALAPAFSRLFKEMILITSKEKPLARAGKGTVMRKASLNIYHNEIETLYETVERSVKRTSEIVPPDAWSEDRVEQWLLKLAAGLSTEKDVLTSTDLFEQGFDSLSATFLRHRIIGSLRSSKDKVVQTVAQGLTQNSIYAHPTIQKLSVYMIKLLEPSSTAAISDEVHIEEVIKKYSEGLEGLKVRREGSSASAHVVLLTGSTGGLGSQILASLLEDARFSKVYAFNRPSLGVQTIFERHVAKFRDKGLDTDLLKSEKLCFLSGDTAQMNLGLDENSYNELRNSINSIIHNAWKVDFNLSLSSFEPHVHGTRNLIDLALSGPNASEMRFLFTSSIASVQSWDKSKGVVPETLLYDASVAVGMGYGESKYITERILAKSGLQASSFRIGQISGGPPKGAWATTDWFPILVKSSLALGALPMMDGVVSWLPTDAVAKAIIDVALTKQIPPMIFNLIHPRPVKWKSIIFSLKEALHEIIAQDIQLIPLHEWLSRLEQRAKDATVQDLVLIPAIKLLDFFRGLSHTNEIPNLGRDVEIGGMANFEMGNIRSISTGVEELRGIEQEDVVRWVRYWQECEFLT